MESQLRKNTVIVENRITCIKLLYNSFIKVDKLSQHLADVEWCKD